MNVDKWKWKMDYCFNHRLPPAQSWAWDMAELEYNNKAVSQVHGEIKEEQ